MCRTIHVHVHCKVFIICDNLILFSFFVLPHMPAKMETKVKQNKHDLVISIKFQIVHKIKHFRIIKFFSWFI